MTRRFALWLLVPLALLAAVLDVALYRFVSDHYAQHGDLGLPLDLTPMAVLLTGMTVYGGIAFWWNLRWCARSKMYGNVVLTPSATRKSRTRKERP